MISPSLSLKPLPPSLQEARERGAEFVRARGLPTRRDENWKYTSLRPLSEMDLALPEGSRPDHETLAAVAGDLNDDFWNLVFVNGVLDRNLSSWEDLPEDLEWSLDPERLVVSSRQDGEASDRGFSDAFEALNSMYLTPCLTLKIRAEAALQKPLRLHFVTASASPEALMVHPRISIDAGPRSKGVIIESYASFGEKGHFTNAWTSFRLGASSKWTHLRLEEESPASVHVGRTSIVPGADAEITSLVFASGGRVSRHHLQVLLTEARATTRSFGLYAGDGEQHIDNTTDIDHRIGDCVTTQIYKGLLGGGARAVFNGRIYIRPGAQKVQSEQLNHNLLLSSKAEADSQPQLMIEADDVKAAHGSTVGHLNAEEIFYLQSRGLTKSQSVPLLAYAFLADVIERLDDRLLESWLEKRLRRQFERFQAEELS